MRGAGRPPEEMAWLAVMDRVGGYLAYLELIENYQAYEDVVLAMAGEADARGILEIEAKMKRP